MFPFKKQSGSQTSKRYVCLDVGTEFLKVIVFSVKNQNIEIIEYLKSRQHNAAMKNGTVTSIRRVIETVYETMQKLHTKRFEGAIMGIAGELVKGVMVEAKYDRQDSSKQIDKYEIQVVAEKIKEDAYKEAKDLVFNQIGDTTGELKNIEMLNYVVVDAEIDGFRVEDPIGMTGSEAKIKIYFTFAPVLHVNYLKTITDSIGIKHLGIIPQPFAISRSISGARNSDFSAIIIDIGGGTTDIAVVQNGVTLGTHMVAFGSRVFTKRISSDLKLTVNEAEEFKIKYSKGELSEVRGVEVRTSLQKDIPFWTAQVAIGLEEFLPLVTGFPHQIYICGGGALLPEIKESLIEFPWTKELPFNRSPKVNFLYPKDLQSIIDNANLLSSVDDVTPASIARFTLEIIENQF
jgi:cell division protein FtsA